MQVFDTLHLRNLALVGHGGCGKTSLVAAALYTAGATPQLGRVDAGTATTDFDEQEIQRGHSISTGVAFAEWSGPDRAACKLNFADTPGHTLFAHEAAAALAMAETVLLAVDAAGGVQVQTTRLWELAAERRLPVIAVITRTDHDHADYAGTLAALRERFGRAVCPLQLPVGEQRAFQGVMDLADMNVRTYTEASRGKARVSAIPATEEEPARKGHEELIELIAEGDDALMEEFFEKGTIPPEHLAAGLRSAIRARRIVPVLITSATANIGVDALLDFCAAYARHPGEASPALGTVPAHPDQPLERPVADAAPVSLAVFKTIADPFAGRLNLFQLRSGRLKSDDLVTNFRTQGQEKFAHLSVLQGKQLVAVPELHAGDWGVIAKLKDTVTGDTLGDKTAPIAYPPVVWPEAAIHFALAAKSRGDEDKVSLALHKMLEEDRALHFARDEQTQEFLLGGSGQQHVEIAVA
ncbi:MAG: GTP-binding protein, partial [Terriglobales bacterium]